MKSPRRKTRVGHHDVTGIIGLLVSSAGMWGQTAWSQQPMPPAPPAQEAPALRPDPFFLVLEGLSKKYHLAFIAEGHPFPQSRQASPPLANATAGAAEEDPTDNPEAVPPPAGLSPEEAVNKIAERFDYTAVHEGNVYVLTKRYSNPDEMPEVTPEECLFALQRNSMSSNVPALSFSNSGIQVTQIKQTKDLINMLRAQEGFVGQNRILKIQLMSDLAQMFYLDAAGTRRAVTLQLLENNRLREPVFRWQTIEKTPVFGYDTRFNSQDNPLFLPLSDSDRIQVAPYGTPVPCPGYSFRYTLALPDPDPTDPANLSATSKQFLDDAGKSSRAITLAETIKALNKRAPGKVVYKVDPAYAAKHVTLVGIETLPPETLMQALGAVYGLGVDHRRGDNSVILTHPLGYVPPSTVSLAQIYWRVYDRHMRAVIPAPIYRAFHARYLAAQPTFKNQGKPEEVDIQAYYAFQSIAAGFRNAAMQRLRYLAEPQVKAQPQQKLGLSRLGERVQILFALAQTASAYADMCRYAEVPLPPYITYWEDFGDNAKIERNIYRAEDGTQRLAFSLTYVNPQTGGKYGPLLFFDSPMN